MPRRNARTLNKGLMHARKKRANWESTWRDAYRYALPQRDIMDQPKPGQMKGDLVFDSTLVWATQRLANRIQSDLFPPFQDFVKLEAGPAVPEDQQAGVNKILEDIAKRFHSALHKSNFDVTIGEFLLEFIVGTGVQLVNEGPDDDPLQFEPIPTPHVALLPGPRGTVGAIYREAKVEAALIKVQWPDADQIPAELEKKIKDDEFAEVAVIEVSYPDYDEGRWYYEVLLAGMGAGQSELTPLMSNPRTWDDHGPWIVSRFIKASNEVYGRGPVLFAMPDSRTANKTMELILKNASLAIAGVYTGVDDGIFNPHTARFAPGTIIPVARNEGPSGPTLRALESGANFDVSQLVLEEMRTGIKAAMYDKQLPPQTGSVRSATEIIERIRDIQVDIGAAFGRIMKELIEPLVLRSLQILNRKGIINFPFKVDGQFIEITVVSPLAQQQSLDDIQSFVNMIEILGLLGPEIMALGIKMEDVPEWIGNKLGVDSKLLRTKEERAELMKSINEAAAKAEGAEVAAEGQGAAAAQPPTGGGGLQAVA